MRALLAGAAVDRSLAAGKNGTVTESVSAADYALVFELLARIPARSLEDLHDPLAVAMVGRANFYLHMLHKSCADARTARIDTWTYNDISRVITRPELADLGNPRSRAFRALVRHIVQNPPGNDILNACRSLGLRNPGRLVGLRAEDATVEWLELNLSAWSAKQARTHFHRLYLEKLITAHKTAANGHWQYNIPEELRVQNPFAQKFPRPEDIWPRNANGEGGTLLVEQLDPA